MAFALVPVVDYYCANKITSIFPQDEDSNWKTVKVTAIAGAATKGVMLTFIQMEK